MTGQPDSDPQHKLQPGQTVIFLGDHTSPDDAGYVRIIGDVLAHFYPQLRLNLISAGSRGQTAGGLRRAELMQIIASSKPDWLVIGVGLGDAMREPSARRLLSEYRRHQAEMENDEAEATFGPEFRVKRSDLGPISDVGRNPEPALLNLGTFKADLAAALAELQGAGVRPVVLTTIVVGNDVQNPVNAILRQYNRAIKEAATEHGALIVDAERAFRDVLDRAGNYKQRVALTGTEGDLNAQGQALLARTVLGAFQVLPYPGYRS